MYGKIAISEKTMLPLACVSMAGVAAEALAFEDVRGQEADLRICSASSTRRSPS